MIEVRNLCAGYGGQPVLQDISLTFPAGKVLAVLGPNGCGKSTLMRTVLGLVPKQRGKVLFDGVDTAALTPRQIAQKAAYLAQSRNVPSIAARRMVLHGRFPYLDYPRRYRAEDYEIARRALDWADAAELADSPMQTLSGGQRQKIYFAMALAQNTQTIFMDEPTTYLDVRHQLDVMEVARRLAGEGRAVVMVLHDLCLAMRKADLIVVMEAGAVRQIGTPEKVFAAGTLDGVFGVAVRRVWTGDGWQYYYG